MKKHLHSTKGKWVEELLGVLWAYETTRRKPTRESPFALTYGVEAIIPTKIGMPTIRAEVPEEASTEAIIKYLDTVDELREAATMCIASYQQRLASWHNRRVKPLTFKTRELVLRRVFKNMSNPTGMKFQHNWEGPYTVVLVRTTESYALSIQTGLLFPECGMPCTSRSIISSVFFKENIINKRLSFTHVPLKPTVTSF